jgi:hypothetical protein
MTTLFEKRRPVRRGIADIIVDIDVGADYEKYEVGRGGVLRRCMTAGRPKRAKPREGNGGLNREPC